MPPALVFRGPRAEGSIPERLYRVVQSIPEQPAVIGERTRLSYRELWRWVQAVAERVRETPAGNRLVGVFCPYGVDAVVAILGAIVADRIVVVFDPRRPAEHHARVIEHTEAAVMVCSPTTHSAATELRVATVVTLPAPPPGDELVPPMAPPDGDALAYLIHTSGSTGEPKGVKHTHHNGLVHALQSATAEHLGPGRRLGMVARFTSGAGLNDLMTALLSGAALCPFDLQHHGVADLARWLDDSDIDVCRTVPTVFRQLAAELARDHTLPRLSGLKVVGLGGETVLPSDIQTFRTVFPRSCRLLVGFGSSETHRIIETFIDADTVVQPRVPVGFALDTVEITLLDEHGTPMGPGPAVGELCVEGSWIGHGYWNDPELSAARFESVAGRPGARRYRSGDTVERRDDGRYVFVARDSDRVMIAGNTVRVAEVEAVLNALPMVVAATVLVDKTPAGRGAEPGEPRLMAFVEAAESNATSLAIRQALGARLPIHMIPGTLVVLDSLPRLASGKVDRRELLALGQAQRVPRGGEPTDTIERGLLKVWRDALAQPSLGIDDDFFEHGGQSLSAVEVLTAVERLYGVRYTAAQLLREPTVAGFAVLVRTRRVDDELQLIAPLRTGGDGPPLFCLPGIAGSPVAMRQVAQLVADAPVYGIDFNPLLTVEPRPTVPQLAERIVGLIRTRSDGPVRVLGYSLGGLLAFEVACILLREGVAVERLIILDMVRPGTPLQWRRRDKLRFHVEQLLSRSPLDTVKFFVRRARDRLRGIKPSDIIDERSAENHPLLLERYDVAQVARTYQPGYFAGPMYLLLCDEPDDGYKRKPDDGGWGDAVHSVVSRRVRMDHHELLEPQRFAEVSAQLVHLL